MKKSSMRDLLGIMRNHQFLIKEEGERTLQTNLNDEDKESILDIINSIKTYRVFVDSISSEDNKIIINASYNHNNYDYKIVMVFNSGNRDSSTIDIQLPEQSERILDANSQTTIYDFCSLLYVKFSTELFDKCNEILNNY